jgi:hypothetical protein
MKYKTNIRAMGWRDFSRDLAVRWRIKLHAYQGSMQKKWADYKESLKNFRIALLRAGCYFFYRKAGHRAP